MGPSFFSALAKNFSTWWHAPVTRRDRFLGSFVGGVGGFWIGLIGRALVGSSIAGYSNPIAWGHSGSSGKCVAGPTVSEGGAMLLLSICGVRVAASTVNKHPRLSVICKSLREELNMNVLVVRDATSAPLRVAEPDE